MDKIFVLDNFSFVQDKKYFVRADGWGISLIDYPYVIVMLGHLYKKY